MPEPKAVETTETTEETQATNESDQDVDTPETTPAEEGEEWTEEQQSEYIASMLQRGGGGSEETTIEKQATESTEEKEDDESEETEEEAVDTEAEVVESDEQEEATSTGTIEIEVDGKKESFDLTDEEQRSKLVQFAQKGRFLERERAKDADKSKQFVQLQQQLDQQSASVGFQMLYLANEGKLETEDFQEKPYELFIGKGEDEKEDLKLWNDDKKRVATNIAKLREFGDRYKQSFDKFVQMSEKFAQSHPDIEDTPAWVEENISPYQNAVLSYGALEYPEDTLEMIYFWKNKDTIIENKVKEALKGYIKKKPIKSQTTTSEMATSVKIDDNPVRETIQRMFGSKGRKLVH